MLRRWFFASCLLSAGALAGCVSALGDSTVDDDALPDASTTADGGGTSDDASTPGEDGSKPDVAADASADAPDDADAGCAPPTVACGDGCFDLADTKEHCGTCETACVDGDGTSVCGQRRCECLNADHTYCANAGCFATKTDSQHCGDTCTACGPGSSCQGGACVCDANFAECQPGTCTSLATDTNCGRCGNTCGAGASCVQGKCRFAETGATCPPWGLAYGATSGSIYWTEFCSGGGAIRRCPAATGCQTVPVALYSAPDDSLPCGIVAAKGSDDSEYYFNTDNQGPNNNRLWRSLGTGADRRDWSGISAGGPGAIVTNGTYVWWGTSGLIYRSSVNSEGATAVLDANPSILTPGSAPQGVALDATYVYAARQGVPNKQDGVVACPIANDCTTSGEIQLFTGAGVSAIVSDGTNVFVSTRTSGVDSVYRCPLAGCGASAQPFWTANVDLNPGRPIPLAVDANNVYINSRSGELLECVKDQVTCATPKVLHPNVNAGSMITLDGYVYWTEGMAPRGVYRTQP